MDVVGILTESPNPNNYWKVLKNRLKKEGSQLVTYCNQLKIVSSDGKYYKTDVADTEQLFRFIQSIPSPKAAQESGNVAKVALKELEAKTGKKVVTSISAKTLLENNKQ